MVRPFGLLLVFLLTLTLAAFAQGQSTPSGVGQATPEAAANPPAGSLAQLSTKGIVTAKGDRSIAIRESGGVLHIVATAQTQVSGLRKAFVDIAVSDIVRAEGIAASTPRVMTAHRVDVLFAAEATERTRAKPLHKLLGWIKNGGITVDLP